MFVHEMLAKAAKDFPDKIGIRHKSLGFTYSWLEMASDRVAGFLLRNGALPGDRIGIFSSKNIEEIIALYAILKIGCIFVHINPHYKEDQLIHVTENCGMKILFLHHTREKTILNAFPDLGPFRFIVNMSEESELKHEKVHFLRDILNEDRHHPPFPEIRESNHAAIIYTSGSTGRPKGIIVTHRVFSDSTHISAQVLKNKDSDRLISLTPFSFDGALSQLFTAVLAGGTLVLQDSVFPKDIVNTILSEKITGIHAMPSFWRMLMQSHSPLFKYRYPDLRYISIIGEAFPENELLKLRKILNTADFYMMYGITEAFRSTVLMPSDFNRKINSVGKPLPGVDILIIDEDASLCGPDEIGQIVHKGVFVSPGYWNDPEKSGKVFKNEMVYTGDLGRKDKEGYLYFVGRKDNMFKIMGYRINPEEIEDCLYKLAGIREAAVIAFPDDDKSMTIKAVVSCDEGVTEKNIVAHCQKCLPYYMVPKVIEFRAELPKTGTFKINRASLKQ